MYRFHIKPIQEQHASSEIAVAYKEIQEFLQLESVPLVFQYIANYEQYFFYIWARMKANLLSAGFQESCDDVDKFVEQAVAYFDTPSPAVSHFVKTIHPAELSQISKVVKNLDHTNLTMMLLMIGVRESIKGIYQARTELPRYESAASEQSLDEILQVANISKNHEGSAEITKAARMLAPLFGNNALMISYYPDFFAHIATEMERLENMEPYLLTRVGLEHLGMAYIEQFAVPLNCSYAEFMRLTEGDRYVDEILYLLKDTFPSRFPHLGLTTGVMKKSLQGDNSALVQ